jgi:hypothetical protein
MTDTNNMIHITQDELQQLVRQDACCIGKTKQRMIRENCPQAHRPCVQNSFMAETAQACMAMHNLYLLSYDDIPEYWEEREDCWKGSSSVYDQERYMVDLESIREVSHTGSALVRVGDDNDLVASVDEFRG